MSLFAEETLSLKNEGLGALNVEAKRSIFKARFVIYDNDDGNSIGITLDADQIQTLIATLQGAILGIND